MVYQFSEPLAWEKLHQGPIECICLSNDGRHLASGGADAKLIIWNARTGTALYTLVAAHAVKSMAWCEGPDMLLCGLTSGHLLSVELLERKVNVMAYEMSIGPINTLAVTRGDAPRTVAIGGRSNAVIWEWGTDGWKTVRLVCPPEHQSRIHEEKLLAWTKWLNAPDDSILGIAYTGTGVFFYDVLADRFGNSILVPDCGSFDISSDNRSIAVSVGGTCNVYDRATGMLQATLTRHDSVHATLPVMFSFDDAALCVTSRDGKVNLWVRTDDAAHDSVITFEWALACQHQGLPAQSCVDSSPLVRTICTYFREHEAGGDSELGIFTASSIEGQDNCICKFEASS